MTVWNARIDWPDDMETTYLVGLDGKTWKTVNRPGTDEDEEWIKDLLENGPASGGRAILPMDLTFSTDWLEEKYGRWLKVEQPI